MIQTPTWWRFEKTCYVFPKIHVAYCKQNWCFVDVSPFPRGVFSVSILDFRGCKEIKKIPTSDSIPKRRNPKAHPFPLFPQQVGPFKPVRK